MRKVKPMKTINEVIKANECCTHDGGLDSRCEDCPYSGIGACILERETDALHYLKQYQEVTSTLHKHGIGSVWGITLPNPEKVEGKLDIDEAIVMMNKPSHFDKRSDFNPPLTWKELSNMKGKPVWMEFKNGDKFWIVIYNVGRLQDGTLMLTDKTEFYTDRGKDWNAYRRERQ